MCVCVCLCVTKFEKGGATGPPGVGLVRYGHIAIKWVATGPAVSIGAPAPDSYNMGCDGSTGARYL